MFPPPPRRPRPARVLAATAALVAVLVTAACNPPARGPAPFAAEAGVLGWPTEEPRPISAAEAANYVGSEACVECHQQAARDHAASRHATTLHPGSDPAFRRAFQSGPGARVKDPDYGFEYVAVERNGERLIRVHDLAGWHEAAVLWAFGSGKHGHTFLCGSPRPGPEPRTPAEQRAAEELPSPTAEEAALFLEARISYYSRSGKWDITPGQTSGPVSLSPLGRTQSLEEAQKCFLCHSSAVVSDGRQIDTRASRFQVGCESCHGPGRAHVDAARRGAPPETLKSPKLTPETSIALCGRCHRTVGEGQRPPGVEQAARVVRFQGVGLTQSRCFQESGGRLTCLTCHEPHKNAETNHEGYVRACRGCHTGTPAGSPTCPVSPQSGCVSCHMTPETSGFPQGMRFFDHWIRIRGKDTGQAGTSGAERAPGGR